MSKKLYWGLTTLIILIGTGVFLYVKADQKHTVDAHIAAAEELIIDGNYYEALFALKPLLMSDEKSETQEKALWIAHQLGEKITEIFLASGGNVPRIRSEKAIPINQLGATIYYADMRGMWYYDKGFLQRLIDEYPNSPKRPIAEYYLIYNERGIPRCGNYDEALKRLHAYVEKYEKTGRPEVYKAYLGIAHINHGFWWKLTYSATEKDKQRAAMHKAEALKYYALYHINPHGLPDDESYERLKKNEEYGWHFIISEDEGGC